MSIEYTINYSCVLCVYAEIKIALTLKTIVMKVQEYNMLVICIKQLFYTSCKHIKWLDEYGHFHEK